MDPALKQAFAWIEDLFQELRLPGVTISTFQNLPSLSHRGKALIGSKDGTVLVVNCPLDTKDMLIAAQPDLFHQTDHYTGYPAVLMYPAKLDKRTLSTRILAAWRMNATQAQRAEYERIRPSDAL